MKLTKSMLKILMIQNQILMSENYYNKINSIDLYKKSSKI